MSTDDTLTPSQATALAQLRDLTNGGDDEVAVSVLQSVDWDVERAAEVVFGGSTSAYPSTYTAPPSTGIEAFEIDDSEQGQSQPLAQHPNRRGNAGWSISNVLLFPLHLVTSLLRFLFGVLRIPIPRPFAFNINLFRPRTTRRPPRGDGGADRWLRELEEETGAVCFSVSASGVDSGVGEGSSNLTNRAGGEGRRVLPDFARGTYEDALRIAQREARVMCVVLVSEEHDDVLEFKRTTLTDPALVRLLHENNVLVWGGDVRDRDPHSAALKLQATTYPFVAFLALQPRRSLSTRSSDSSSTNTALTILSRHQGPPTSTTSPATLLAHLESTLLPRVTPFLGQLQAKEREREADRRMREEQDRRVREAERRDGERIGRLMKEEEDARRREQERREREANDARRHEQEREREEARRRERGVWRRWVRRALKEEGEGVGLEGDGEVRLAIRMPDGARVVRRFGGGRSLTALYAFVDAQLADAEGGEVSPNGHSPNEVERAMEEKIAEDASGADKWWGFRLVLAYPRSEIPWAPHSTVGEVQSLKGGGQLVVHIVETAAVNGNGDDGADEDGYVSEE
ncbi:hypothetical protein DFH07DRAFT_905360 [Mycena maculata]|uniref:UBX domain-containing protein n=1 Tax=Mycena maculata TaxID=230809 RepID=A0AAD7IDY0_9AGAR|nr:hypothetical protein DFH07DRAFT_905360 [Mycena maculata]